MRLHSQFYRSTELVPLIARRTRRNVRFDPRDISRVYVDADDRYIVASAVDLTVPPCSLWEWNEVRARQREEGRDRHCERIDRRFSPIAG